MQLPLIPTAETTWRPPELSALPSWRGARRVAFDLETYDPHLKDTGPSVRTGGYIAGIGFAIEGGPKHYLPIRHMNGDNMPVDAVLAYIKDQFKNFDGEVVGANLSYDLDYAWEAGIEMPNVATYRDVLVAEPCIDENKFFYSLDSVAKDWIGEQKEKTKMLQAARDYGLRAEKELGSYIHIVPGRFVGEYGEQDVALPLKILRLQEEEIDRQGIREVWDLESAVLPALVRMRRRGVRVNEQKLFDIEVRCSEERAAAARFISQETGVPVGPDQAMQKGVLTKALRAAGHDINADASIDRHFIARHAQSCEVVSALGRLRKWDTLRKLCIEPVKNHLVNGRIHCSFNQMAADKDDGKGTKGARYGRLSSEHVNMQQQPSRDEEIGPMWRDIYEPEEGLLWGSNDYSQQEPRVLMHWSEAIAELGRMPEHIADSAYAAAKAYRDDPSTDNHQMMADMAGVTRKQAKIIFLGLTYGMGQEKLCQDLGLPTEVIVLKKGPKAGQKMIVAGPEGKRLFETFHQKVPFLKYMENLCKDRATSNGYIRTLSGRRCRFRIGDDGLNYWGTHKALNRLIQGSAADQTKRALVEADKAGFFIQLQVHDEITGSFSSREEAEQLAAIMRDCVELRVPSKVDVEIGPSWGRAT